MGVSAPGRAMAARWIHIGHSAVNLAQVCRIEYRRNDVSCKEICGFDLYLVDGTAVTLYWGDAGFEQVAEELREQGIELILGWRRRDEGVPWAQRPRNPQRPV